MPDTKLKTSLSGKQLNAQQIRAQKFRDRAKTTTIGRPEFKVSHKSRNSSDSFAAPMLSPHPSKKLTEHMLQFHDFHVEQQPQPQTTLQHEVNQTLNDLENGILPPNMSTPNRCEIYQRISQESSPKVNENNRKICSQQQHSHSQNRRGSDDRTSITSGDLESDSKRSKTLPEVQLEDEKSDEMT